MKKVIIFLIGLCLILSLCNFIVIPKNNDLKTGLREYNALGVLNEPKDSIDVLFLGDSEVYSAISPMEIYRTTKITSYDLSISAQKLYTCYEVLKQTFKYQSSQLVILETNTVFRKMDQRNVFLSQMGEYIPLIKYHDRWKHLSLQDFRLKPRYEDHNILKGYKVDGSVDSGSNRDYMKYNQNKESIDEINLEYVKKIHQLCKEKGCQLILLSVPSQKNWNYTKHNTIEALANELEIDFIDLNLVELGIDWKKDTRDKGDHVNYTGSMKVSNYLGSYIIENYPINKHDLNQIWQDDLAYYDEYLEKKMPL